MTTFMKYVFCFLLFCSMVFAGPFDASWKKFDEAMEKDLPKSAIAELKSLDALARQQKSWPDAIRATAYRMMLDSKIEEGDISLLVAGLDQEIATAPDEMKPVLQTMQAMWLWAYFQENQWQIMERTAIADDASTDLKTWDLKRMMREIDARFTKALALAEPLKQVAISTYQPLLESGNIPEEVMPTMYDFLLQQALAFYAAEERVDAAAEDDFTFDPASPAFANAADFIAWKPPIPSGFSAKIRAISLYQQWLAFHQDRLPARMYVDVKRRHWATSAVAGEVDAARQEKEWRALLEQARGQEVECVVAHALASQLDGLQRRKEAREIADAAVKAHPKSVLSSNCQQLIADIDRKEMELSTERSWNAAGAVFTTTYRNIDKVWFRLYPAEWKPELQPGMEEKNYDAMIGKAPVKAWSIDLEATDDFLPRTKQLQAPHDIAPGCYYLVSSHREDFSRPKNLTCMTLIWRSDLMLVTDVSAASNDGIVTDALSGKVKVGAEVELWAGNYNQPWKVIKSGKTNAEGKFSLPTAPDLQTVIVAREGKDFLPSSNGWNHGLQEANVAQTRTYIFTDRAIYRPGQTIRFKALQCYYDRSKNDYHAVVNQLCKVELFDMNGKQVSQFEAQTNAFGSISGSFTAPSDRALGMYTLRSVNGMSSIRIEEYKRPKFEVTVGDATAPPKLDQKVTVSAKAISYTGAAIDGAKVKWTVTRATQWPDWCRWCWWFAPQGESKQIAHGEGITKADGSVEITFVAEPDRSVKPENSPIFSYDVAVEITDSTGETREDSRSVKAAYVDTQASMQADAWQQVDADVKISVNTSTVDDAPVARKGSIVVHRLIEPKQIVRSLLAPSYHRWNAPSKDEKNPNDPNSWELGDVVQRNEFSTDAEGKAEISVRLPAGEYRAVLETVDSTGAKVTALLPLRVIDLASNDFPVMITDHFRVKASSLEPGQEFVACWGTGYEEAQFYYEIVHRGKVLRSAWSDGTNTQAILRFPVTQELRGGFQVRAIFVRDNRAYVYHHRISVPWSQHDLRVKFETMRSKLEPGAKETWTVVVEGAKKDQVEMVAALYDASLDAFAQHTWSPSLSGDLYADYFDRNWISTTGLVSFQQRDDNWNPGMVIDSAIEWHWDENLGINFSSRAVHTAMADRGAMLMETADAFSTAAPMAKMAIGGNRSGSAVVTRDSINGILNNPSGGGAVEEKAEQEKAEQEKVEVAPRKNLQETAFFEPHLTTDEKGVIRMTFTMPEALTKWRFLGFAHDASLRSGSLGGETVTAKDLMCQPNPPRFLREGDEIEFTAKVSNLSDKPQQGTARLTFADAITLESRDATLALQNAEQAFDVPAKESRTISWRIKVPDGAGFLNFIATASSATLSDGEEGMIPVLSRRQLVTESITLPIRDVSTREFELKKLLESATSDTLRHQSVTVEVVSQPAWYAVMALPYLMEYPYECAEQTFNRWYANQLARHIAQSDPKIRRVFDAWRTAPKTLDSPLLKNQDLKSLLIEETPWLRDAGNETEARRNVAVLFDDNRIDSESARAMKRLSEMQNNDGSWSWFPGGPGSDYITLYLVTGTGRLQHLGVKIDNQHALRALDWLDAQITKRYNEINPGDRDENHFDSFIAMYLYGRSFYVAQRPIAEQNKEAVDYFLAQAAQYWAEQKSLMTRCHSALGLHRFGNKDVPAAIVASLRENARNTDELGMHWRSNENYYWHQAPVETQAMIIETLREVASDDKAVDDCQVWLLKQKQTQGWKTTKATADAVYALLLGGANKLSSDALVSVELGGVAVKPENVEVGTGFYQKKFSTAEIKAEMGKVKLTKADKGVSWGSLHWQYLEDVSKITPHEGNPLEVKKSLFVNRSTAQGKVLEAVKGPLAPGDELVTRIEIRVDRNMEYVHLKNQRGSGTEPTNVLSQYKWQDGLGYYEMTKDTADHFFIEYLPRGTYVFETSARIQLRGLYPSGIAEIQCMYAPEFNSHSASTLIEVK
jgi:uncharacterized protein YfaS (alpha-2-macroglobulin family)